MAIDEVNLAAWAQVIQFAEDTEEVKSAIAAIKKVPSPSDRVEIRDHIIMALWLDGARQRKDVQVLENDLQVARTEAASHELRLRRIEGRVRILLK